MDGSELDDIDYRSLRFLGALLDTGSLSQAARLCGVSQPTASRILGRWREVLGDPILVRGRHGYLVTDEARGLRELVAAAFQAVDRVVRREGFAPLTSRRTFHVAATDYCMTTVAPDLMRKVRDQAPLVVVQFHPLGPETLSDLTSGALDMAYWFGEPPEPFHSRELFREDLLGVVCQRHPLSHGRVTIDDLLSFPHVRVSLGQSPRSPVDLALGEMGLSRRVAFVVAHFSTALAALPGTDLIMKLSTRLAGTAAEQGLATFPLPIALPPISYRVIWHPRSDGDPALAWLRSLLR